MIRASDGGFWMRLVGEIRASATADPAALVRVQRGYGDYGDYSYTLHRAREWGTAWCGADTAGSLYLLRESAVDCAKCKLTE